MVDHFVVHVNYKKHMVYYFVVHGFCGSHEPQMGPPCDFVVHMNHKKHMEDPFVVHVFFVVHINHKWVHHVFLWFT